MAKKGSAEIYDFLYIVITSVLMFTLLFVGKDIIGNIGKLLEKANAQTVAIDLAGTITGIQLSPFDAEISYCFPKEKNYKVEIDGRLIKVQMFSKGNKLCEKEFCKGVESLPENFSESKVIYSDSLSDRCIYLEKIGEKVMIRGVRQ